ncbi:MAG TPA: aminoglycoside phosphotransferase family protein [Pilimelia sp.]|nr:aminoglycoside phosphotransferase family protein [Pilimelia sp.]
MSTAPPAVPYEATAQRPDWADLPAAVRAAVAHRLGSRVVGATTARGGFSSAFTAVLRTAAGDRVFLKAAARDEHPLLADWYAREAAITAALPAAVRAARPRWSMHVAGYALLCLDAVPGRMPVLPWRAGQLAATLDAWAAAAEALADPPAGLRALRLPRLADIARADLAHWAPVAAGRAPLPAGTPRAVAAHVAELADLEAAVPGYVDAPGVTHLDLRADNVLIDADGAAWFCDWNWSCHGAAWFDTAVLLVTAHASGLDADALFVAHPTARGVPPEALDALLAAMTGYWLHSAAEPPVPGSPWLRRHQRWSGEQAFAWLARRRGWG